MELPEQHLSFAKNQMNSKRVNPNRGKFLLQRKIITYIIDIIAVVTFIKRETHL